MKRLLTAPFRALAWPFSVLLHGLHRVLQLARDHTSSAYALPYGTKKNQFGSDGEIIMARFVCLLLVLAILAFIGFLFVSAPTETMLGLAALFIGGIVWFIVAEGRKARKEKLNPDRP